MADAIAPAASDATSAAAAGGAPAAAPTDQGGAPASATSDSSSTPAGEAKPAGEGGNEGAPESYTDFTAPENVVLDTPVLDKFKGLAKQLNLSQEKAQALITELGPEIAAAQNKQLAETVSKAQKEWEAQARGDQEYGGEKLDANLAVAERGLEAFGTPELKKLLKSSGLSYHPEVIRFCYRAGLAVKEDGHVSGGAAQGEKSAAQVLFGSK